MGKDMPIPIIPLTMEDIKETLVCVLKSTLRTKIVRGMMANALMTSTQPITRTRDWFTKHLLDLLSPFKDKIVILGENCDSDSFFADNYHYAKKTIKERLHIEI